MGRTDTEAKMGRMKLIQTRDGWAVDHANTSEAAHIMDAFGTTVLPLPLTSAVSREDALAFARQTPAGREHGVC